MSLDALHPGDSADPTHKPFPQRRRRPGAGGRCLSGGESSELDRRLSGQVAGPARFSHLAPLPFPQVTFHIDGLYEK